RLCKRCASWRSPHAAHSRCVTFILAYPFRIYAATKGCAISLENRHKAARTPTARKRMRSTKALALCLSHLSRASYACHFHSSGGANILHLRKQCRVPSDKCRAKVLSCHSALATRHCFYDSLARARLGRDAARFVRPCVGAQPARD